MTTNQTPLLERYKYPVFVLIAVAILAGIAVLLAQRPNPTTITVLPPDPTAIPSATPIPSSTPTPGPFTVYITGAVATPEAVITIEYGSRVLHALDAVGGALDEADLQRVNLAQKLEDGDQVHVPTRPPDAASPTPRLAIVTATPGVYVVYVTGEVANPQTIVNLSPGSRVQDALDAVGGATDNADLSRVNLSQILNDGDQVHVPPLRGDDIQTPTPNHLPLVHINHAGLEELDTLPGIGPALAQTIVDYREANGPFASLEALDNVSGIGPATLEALRDLVVFD